jgi:hypothetical protein
MADQDWKWWVGHCEERFHTQCDTRDEAVQIARDDYDGGYIVEATQESNIALSDYIDIEQLLEMAEDRAHDDHGDPEGDMVVFEVTQEQTDDLEKRIRAEVENWQKAQGLTFRGWRFSAARNGEYIPGADDPDGEGEA